MPPRTSEKDEKAQKERYLRAVRTVGTLTAGCRAAKVSPNTIYKWREHDDEFMISERQARETCADVLEASVLRRAKGRSDVLAMFMLKAMRPEKYRDRIGVEHSGTIGTVDSELDDRITAQLATMAARGENPLPLASSG